MREKIEDILHVLLMDNIPDLPQTANYNLPDTNETTDKILALFDISKVEVEEECVLCQGYGDHSIDGKLCNGASLRPATWDDLAKGGILKVRE